MFSTLTTLLPSFLVLMVVILYDVRLIDLIEPIEELQCKSLLIPIADYVLFKSVSSIMSIVEFLFFIIFFKTLRFDLERLLGAPWC